MGAALKKTCTIAECTGEHFGKGWCNKHYQRWRSTGDPLGLKQAENTQDIEQMTATECAWVAGLFEGEGYVGLAKGLYPQVVIQMIDQDVIERLQSVVGNGSITKPAPRDGHQQLYRWTKTGATFVQQFFEAVAPYLGERRLGQFQAALAQKTTGLVYPRGPHA